ncbi:hypothetical protein [Algihabitans albus]|uniref:hypothetical protein n=1 Tax=Algihabitans albus TaxID=2164067 RepID=UPI000E5D7457|nr:hypothetical protein [Algihabitans albus]
MPAAALPFLLVLFLVLAAPGAEAQSQTGAQSSGEASELTRSLAALKAGGSEFYLHPLESGWVWQAVDSQPPFHAMTFAPEGQSQRGWTDGLQLGILRDDARTPEDLLGWAERRLATECRDLRRSGLEQGETDEGWSEAWRLFSCPSRLDEGPGNRERGEIRLLRAVQGERAAYLIARIWRTDSFEAAVPVSQSEVEQARDLLAAGGPCLRDSARSTCPFYSSMGLGALDDAKPYGVFNVR